GAGSGILSPRMGRGFLSKSPRKCLTGLRDAFVMSRIRLETGFSGCALQEPFSSPVSGRRGDGMPNSRGEEVCVVSALCNNCKYTDCVTVCPVDNNLGAFYQDDRQLYIHPEECIGCEACIKECPVTVDGRKSAIFTESELDFDDYAKWKEALQINATRSEELK